MFQSFIIIIIIIIICTMVGLIVEKIVSLFYNPEFLYIFTLYNDKVL